jgi:hypothetical protein
MIAGRPGHGFVKGLIGQVFEGVCADTGHGRLLGMKDVGAKAREISYSVNAIALELATKPAS